MMAQDEDRTRLLDAARALLGRGDAKFSITALCAEAGLDRAAFRTHFTGKAALLSAAMAENRTPEKEPEPKAEAKPFEPGVSTPDAWLERRLRVFERALNQLEVRAEAAARAQETRMAQLQEQIARLSQSKAVAPPAAVIAPEAEPEPGPQPGRPAPELLAIAPLPIVTVPRTEMADMLQAARDRIETVPEDAPRDGGRRLRWLAIGGLSLVALLLCIGLTLGNTASATQQEGNGVAYRHVARGAVQQLVARADAGDAQAQAKLALAYLRGEGVQSDAAAAARWSTPAAQAGQPIAQYLLGTLYGQGQGVKPDAARAFRLFRAAAAKGNLKAMHNLAIAYAQGLGTARDEARAADWFARAAEHGYVDSAFDLAVLYERGQGVKQDLKQAMKWYAIAAFAGDVASQERVAVLRSQMKPDEIAMAMTAASGFSPLQALPDANRL
jgi:AcrR family transcriptional regulator